MEPLLPRVAWAMTQSPPPTPSGSRSPRCRLLRPGQATRPDPILEQKVPLPSRPCESEDSARRPLGPGKGGKRGRCVTHCRTPPPTHPLWWGGFGSSGVKLGEDRSAPHPTPEFREDRSKGSRGSCERCWGGRRSVCPSVVRLSLVWPGCSGSILVQLPRPQTLLLAQAGGQEAPLSLRCLGP